MKNSNIAAVIKTKVDEEVVIKEKEIQEKCGELSRQLQEQLKEINLKLESTSAQLGKAQQETLNFKALYDNSKSKLKQQESKILKLD